MEDIVNYLVRANGSDSYKLDVSRVPDKATREEILRQALGISVFEQVTQIFTSLGGKLDLELRDKGTKVPGLDGLAIRVDREREAFTEYARKATGDTAPDLDLVSSTLPQYKRLALHVRLEIPRLSGLPEDTLMNLTGQYRRMDELAAKWQRGLMLIHHSPASLIIEPEPNGRYVVDMDQL